MASVCGLHSKPRILFEAIVRFVSNLVDRKRSRGAVGMLPIVSRERFRDLDEPLPQLLFVHLSVFRIQRSRQVQRYIPASRFTVFSLLSCSMGRAFNAGFKPAIPALNRVISGFGVEGMNKSAPITGDLCFFRTGGRFVRTDGRLFYSITFDL